MAKAPTISIYIRQKGKNFQIAPATPDHSATYYFRYYSSAKQCWQKVGQYDYLKPAKLILERQLFAQAHGFVISEDQRDPR